MGDSARARQSGFNLLKNTERLISGDLKSNIHGLFWKRYSLRNWPITARNCKRRFWSKVHGLFLNGIVWETISIGQETATEAFFLKIVSQVMYIVIFLSSLQRWQVLILPRKWVQRRGNFLSCTLLLLNPGVSTSATTWRQKLISFLRVKNILFTEQPEAFAFK